MSTCYASRSDFCGATAITVAAGPSTPSSVGGIHTRLSPHSRQARKGLCCSYVDVNRIKEYRQEAAKLTGEASLALLFRHLSASRLITIAQIEGRVRAAGSEFVLACDMRFAALEPAIFAQFERRSVIFHNTRVDCTHSP